MSGSEYRWRRSIDPQDQIQQFGEKEGGDCGGESKFGGAEKLFLGEGGENLKNAT